MITVTNRRACTSDCCVATIDTGIRPPRLTSQIRRPMFEVLVDVRNLDDYDGLPSNTYLENGVPVDDWHF